MSCKLVPFVSFLVAVPALVLAIIAYTKAPPPPVVVTNYGPQILQLENTLASVVGMLSHNVTQTRITVGTCSMFDDNGDPFSTSFEAYSLNFDMGDFATIVLEIQPFSAPISAQYVELTCLADDSDFTWSRFIVFPSSGLSADAVVRIFSNAMLANFTLTSGPRAIAADFGLHFPNYALQSPPFTGAPGAAILISWAWDDVEPVPWNYGVDTWNINGVMKFVLASSYAQN